MKLKILINTLILTLILGTGVIKAQDNSVLAQNAYTKAEEYFSQKDYGKALSQLTAAEQYLGETNSKILYFKVNILKEQFSKSSSYYSTLKSTLSQFFNITDKNTYPADKYIEMVRLQSDLDDFIKADSIASNKLLNNGDLASIKSYLNSYPNTFYSIKLSNKRMELQKVQDEIDAKTTTNNRLKELKEEISRARAKSFNRRFWGGFAFLGGGAIGATALLEKGSDDESTEETVLRPILGGLGIAACAMGAVYLIGGNHREVKSLKKEQSNLLKRQKALTFSIQPFYKSVLAFNSFGLKVKVNF